MSTTSQPVTYFYRYVDVQYASLPDEYGERRGVGRPEVELEQYQVVKVTRCGVRLCNGRFVNLSSRKRFACPTKADALVSFKARKQRQLSILLTQVSRVEEALAIANRIEAKGEA
jgi:hypothetical protein